jgi:hypothetical protein
MTTNATTATRRRRRSAFLAVGVISIGPNGTSNTASASGSGGKTMMGTPIAGVRRPDRNRVGRRGSAEPIGSAVVCGSSAAPTAGRISVGTVTGKMPSARSVDRCDPVGLISGIASVTVFGVAAFRSVVLGEVISNTLAAGALTVGALVWGVLVWGAAAVGVLLWGAAAVGVLLWGAAAVGVLL